MNKKLKNFIRWTPRILSILLILFLSIFALDVFGEYKFPLVLVALFMHLLPSLFLVTVLIIAWKVSELIGGIVFILMALFYVVMAWGKMPFSVFWIIPFPALVIGGLFIWSWYLRKKK